MVRVKVWHIHTTVWLLKNYSQCILTYYMHMLLLVIKYVSYAYFIIGPNVRSHYDLYKMCLKKLDLFLCACIACLFKFFKYSITRTISSACFTTTV